MRSIVSPRTPRSRQAFCKPWLEILEDRLTPSFAVGAGGLLQDSGQSVATDVAGNVYIAGNLGGTLSAIDTDSFVAKYSASGALMWSQVLSGRDILGNSYGDSANAIALDKAGNVFVAGDFRGRVDFGNNIVLTSTGAIDFFVEKLDKDGNVLWAHQFATDGNFGPPIYDRIGTLAPKGIAVDSHGAVVVTGFFSADMDMDPVHAGQHVLHSIGGVGGHADAFVAKLNGAGNFVWDAQIKDLDGVNAYAVAVDVHDNVYTLGGYQNTATFNDSSNNPHTVVSGSNRNTLYVWRLDSGGHTVWVSSGADQDVLFGLSIAVDVHGNIYITGSFSGVAVDFDPAVAHADDTLTSTNGSADVFIEKRGSAGNFLWVRQAGGIGFDQGTGTALDSSGNLYVTGYITADSLFGNQLLKPVSPLGNSFLTELNPSGDFLCAQKSMELGAAAPDGDQAAAIAVDPKGFVSIVGTYTTRMQWPGLPPLNSVAGSSDIFAIKTRLTCSPTHVTVVDGHILQIVGDNQANHIVVINDPDWGFLVNLDDDASRVFIKWNRSIDLIDIQAGGGNDTVSLGGPDTAGNPEFKWPGFVIDLGGGDDELTFSGQMGAYPGNFGLSIDIAGGDGSDLVAMKFSGTQPIPGLRVDMGRGNDTFTVNAVFSYDDLTAPPPPDWSVAAGAGNDLVSIDFSIPVPCVQPPNLTINGAEGDDDIRVFKFFQGGISSPEATPPATSRLDIIDKKGNNDIAVNYGIIVTLQPDDTATPVFDTALETSIRTGGGHNDISVLYDYNGTFQSPDLIMAAPITLDIVSGGSTDRISVSLAHTSLADASGGNGRFLFEAPVSINILSGAGNDTATVMMGDASTNIGSRPPVLNSLIRLLMDGEDGHDVMAANLFFAEESLGQLDVQVLGSKGNDDLTLNNYLLYIDGYSALIDGGPGFDTAHHTPNVMVLNCER